MISFLQDLLFIGKLQQMVRLIIFVVSGIHEIFFSLRPAVIAVRHHQIPVDVLFYRVLGRIKGILTFSDVLDDRGGDSRLFLHLSERCFLKFLSRFYGSLRQDPSFILVPVIFIQNQDFSTKYYHTAAARCFDHCNSLLTEGGNPASMVCIH